ncbi:MAG: type II secretion system protein [Synergistaceae bacterium]|nr:type II secretion system protein [Synergistaceae bacterium]
MKREMKRRGFTLVELLIVIVVIGILSAMMMMSSSEAVSSARASTITSNMRNLQTAALAYWSDNMGKFNKTTPDAPVWDDLIKYLKEDDKADINDAGYNIEVSTNSNTQGDWYITYSFSTNRGDDTRIANKIAGRASALGIVGSTEKDAKAFTAPTSIKDKKIYLRVR